MSLSRCRELTRHVPAQVRVHASLSLCGTHIFTSHSCPSSRDECRSLVRTSVERPRFDRAREHAPQCGAPGCSQKLAQPSSDTQVFHLEATCKHSDLLAESALTAGHLSTGWWAACRDAVKVKAAVYGVVRAALDDQFAVVSGNASAAYYDGAVRGLAL